MATRATTRTPKKESSWRPDMEEGGMAKEQQDHWGESNMSEERGWRWKKRRAEKVEQRVSDQ